MLTHLRIEAVGRSYEEVRASLEQITRLVTENSWPSTFFATYALATGGIEPAPISQGASGIRDTIIPSTWRIQEDGGEVIERIVERRSAGSNAEKVFFRGRRNLVFEARTPDVNDPPTPNDWWIFADGQAADMLERALRVIDGNPGEDRERFERDAREALRVRTANFPGFQADRVLEVVDEVPKPTAADLAAFTALTMRRAVSEIAFGPAKPPMMPGYEIDLMLYLPVGDGMAVGQTKTAYWGPTFGDAITAASAAVDAFESR